MRLFIGNLPYPATEPALRAFIERWGVTVLSCSEPHRPETGRPYCFVNVPKEQGTAAIRLLNGKNFGAEFGGADPLSVRQAYTGTGKK